jgi:hypothetical protein
VDVPGIGRITHDHLNDLDTCFEVLSGCKHQLLEGLIVENLADQWLSVSASQDEVTEVAQHTLICQRWQSGHEKSPVAFVLISQALAYPDSYIQALSKRMTVLPVICDADSCEFITVGNWRDGACAHAEFSRPLLSALQEWTDAFPKHKPVAFAVRDKDRQRSCFWGFLRTTYGNNLRDRVVIPRLFKDFGPQLFFDAGWDVDRVIDSDGKLWSLEIKHKFPFGRNKLQFGINVGELKSIRWLHEAGISSLHLIIVKPVWDKRESPQYLLNEFDMRGRALVLGLVFDEAVFETITSGGVRESGPNTTFTGEGALRFHSIPVNMFSMLGRVSDPPEIVAKNMVSMMRGEQLPKVTEEDLLECRVFRHSA